jgi:hypothetical protein
MTDRNDDIARLIRLTARHLREELRPELQGRQAFLTLVAANLLDGLARDVATGGTAELDAASRLEALLGVPHEEDVNVELCRLIESGVLDERSPELMRHLRETVLDRLAIEQPTYEAYRRERPA